jgi:hypothetical protein
MLYSLVTEKASWNKLPNLNIIYCIFGFKWLSVLLITRVFDISSLNLSVVITFIKITSIFVLSLTLLVGFKLFVGFLYVLHRSVHCSIYSFPWQVQVSATDTNWKVTGCKFGPGYLRLLLALQTLASLMILFLSRVSSHHASTFRVFTSFKTLSSRLHLASHKTNKMDVRSYRGANIDSDHYLVVTRITASINITKWSTFWISLILKRSW